MNGEAIKLQVIDYDIPDYHTCDGATKKANESPTDGNVQNQVKDVHQKQVTDPEKVKALDVVSEKDCCSVVFEDINIGGRERTGNTADEGFGVGRFHRCGGDNEGGKKDLPVGRGRNEDRQDENEEINQEFEQNKECAPKNHQKPSSVTLVDKSSLLDSFRYAVNTVMRLFLQSTALNIVPTIITVIMFGSTWFFDINNDTMLWHFLITTIFLLVNMYGAISIVCMYIFGKSRVFKLIYKLTIPLSILNVITFIIRELYQMKFFGFVNYVIFFTYVYLLLKSIKTDESKPHSDQARELSRYDILCSDGTPMLIFKGYVAFLIPYFSLTVYIIPHIMKSDSATKILSRVVLLPFVFNIPDTYINHQIMQKCSRLMKYRMACRNLMNFTSSAILRLVTTDSRSIQNTALMATFSAVSEVLLRISYKHRKKFYDQVLELIRYKWNKLFKGNTIHNLDGVSPSGVEKRVADSKMARKKTGDSKMEHTCNSFRIIPFGAEQGGINDDVIHTNLSNHTVFVTMCEIQLSILYPLVIFLCYPIRSYVTFKTFPGFYEMLLNVLIQLPIELITQVISITAERYIYDIRIELRPTSHFIKTLYPVLHSTLSVLVVISLSLSPFRLNTEDWPDK